MRASERNRVDGEKQRELPLSSLPLNYIMFLRLLTPQRAAATLYPVAYTFCHLVLRTQGVTIADIGFDLTQPCMSFTVSRLGLIKDMLVSNGKPCKVGNGTACDKKCLLPFSLGAD